MPYGPDRPPLAGVTVFSRMIFRTIIATRSMLVNEFFDFAWPLSDESTPPDSRIVIDSPYQLPISFLISSASFLYFSAFALSSADVLRP